MNNRSVPLTLRTIFLSLCELFYISVWFNNQNRCVYKATKQRKNNQKNWTQPILEASESITHGGPTQFFLTFI